MRLTVRDVVRDVAALMRLDTLAAAALTGWSIAHVASAWLCTDSACSSGLDTAAFYALAMVATAVAGVLLWGRPRRWWGRTAVLIGALYASNVVPPIILQHGRWSVPMDRGVSCVVRATVPRTAVHESCGIPSRSCEGPKYADFTSVWNPISIRMCMFQADVYRNRVVTYDCTGSVITVTRRDTVPPREFPPGCWGWTAPGGR
jgi:hypothetical protein